MNLVNIGWMLGLLGAAILAALCLLIVIVVWLVISGIWQL